LSDDDTRSARRDRRRQSLDGVWGNVQTTTVRIRDISLGGVGLESNDALAVGRRYRLHIDSENGGQQIDVDVAWCKLVGTQVGEQGDVVPLYRAGARAHRARPAPREDADDGG
jgi:hypothetical protein